ncbi:hypothetical protein [Paracoccus kondratievae]|uniref:hypothetical protein n=1 Tax=Paracoccus kondratievae TaxID=135740 RepID=UPI00187A90F0|nr:hypothetical protein [Paracoccus kondratievae]
MAAIFVRLNRGLPTLDWKSIPLDRRKRLSQAVYDVSAEYLGVLALAGVCLATVLVMIGSGLETFMLWPAWVRNSVGALLGFSLTLTATRMAYVVWRDLDIVMLQKTIVDELVVGPSSSPSLEEVERGRDIQKAMKNSNLQGGSVPVRSDWKGDKSGSIE